MTDEKSGLRGVAGHGYVARVSYRGSKAMPASLFDAAARKRTVSLTINTDLYAKTKAAGINASRVAEQALAEALRRNQAEVLREEIRRDQQALARYVAEHGDPAAELREMFEPPCDAT